MKVVSTVILAIVFLFGAGLGYVLKSLDYAPSPPRPIAAIELYKVNSMCRVNLFLQEDVAWFLNNTNLITGIRLINAVAEPSNP